MRIMHVLYQSYPNVSGSSTRSKSIIDAMNSTELFEPVVVTSPLQEGKYNNSTEVIDGVTYVRTFQAGNEKYAVNKKKSFWVKLKKAFLFVVFGMQVVRLVKQLKPDVVHAHAMFVCGLAGWIAARVSGVKFVYEIRSDWHLDQSFDSGGFFKKIFGGLESFVARRADSLVVISDGLYEKYSKCNERCFVIRNAVHQSMFAECLNVNRPLRPVTFGFIGSVIPLEGLGMVVDAISKARSQGFIIPFIIAGHGESIAEVTNKINDGDLSDQISLMGTLPFERVGDFYEKVDVVVNFRRNEAIAHSVTPLKPLEAMAQRKLVLVSDVRGMTELVIDNLTGVVVPAEDVAALADVLIRVFENFDSYSSIVEQGYNFVKSQRSWMANVKKYAEVYR